MSHANGNGHHVEECVEAIALSAGVRVAEKIVVRLPIICLDHLRSIVKRRKMTGRLSIDCTNGTEAIVTWEGTR